jgi:hypothetical protein
MVWNGRNTLEGKYIFIKHNIYNVILLILHSTRVNNILEGEANNVYNQTLRTELLLGCFAGLGAKDSSVRKPFPRLGPLGWWPEAADQSPSREGGTKTGGLDGAPDNPGDGRAGPQVRRGNRHIHLWSS